MSYFRNYLNLETVWHTALSDAQYLKLNLLLRAEICSSTVHIPKVFADILVRVFEEGSEYFKKSFVKSKLYAHVLRQLHWLPVRRRVEYKVACLVRQSPVVEL